MKSIELYEQEKVSPGLEAKIARLSIWEYIDLLKEYKVRINIDIDDAKGLAGVCENESLAFFRKNRNCFKIWGCIIL